MRIYTKSGDGGETGLIGGSRVSKDDARVEACGALDELNALLGTVRTVGTLPPEIDLLLGSIQGQLFTVGAQLMAPGKKPPRATIPPLAPSWIGALEEAIDRFDADLPPLRHFVLPGGPAALVHLARAVCRRAERRIVTLHRGDPVPAEVLAYVNRLSDLLFVASRWVARRAGVEESIWDPTSSARGSTS